jgi:hypothetical protein
MTTRTTKEITHMAAGDTVRIGPNAIYKGDDRYAPGSEVPASRFTKAELEMFTAERLGDLCRKPSRRRQPPTRRLKPKRTGASSRGYPRLRARPGTRRHGSALMPDTCEIRTVGTSADEFNIPVRTGTDTDTPTESCRRKTLAGRELEVAQGLAATATDAVALPYEAAITEQQEIYHQESAETLRVVFIPRSTLGLEKRVLCERVAQ